MSERMLDFNVYFEINFTIVISGTNILFGIIHFVLKFCVIRINVKTHNKYTLQTF